MNATNATTGTLPAVLAACRRHAGLSLRDLAGRLGVTFQSVGHYETGRNDPPAAVVAAIAAATGCTVTARPDGAWAARPGRKK